MRKKKTEEKQEKTSFMAEELIIQPIMEGEAVKGTVGYELQKAREAKKKEIVQIAKQLRIKPCYLEALEQSRYEDFPGQAYAFGFLRTYSDFLGLDTAALITRYRQERAFIKPETINMPIPEHQELFPSIKYLLWCVLSITLIWSFWYFLTYSENQDALGKAQTNIVKQIEETKKEAEVKEAEVKPVLPATKEEEKKVENAEKTAEAKKPASRIQIVANQEVWFEISQDDSLVVSRTLKKGETYDVPAKSDNMLLKTGNAGGMDVFVDGKKVKALGPSGAVRSNISLSVDKLKNR